MDSVITVVRPPTAAEVVAALTAVTARIAAAGRAHDVAQAQECAANGGYVPTNAPSTTQLDDALRAALRTVGADALAKLTQWLIHTAPRLEACVPQLRRLILVAREGEARTLRNLIHAMPLRAVISKSLEHLDSREIAALSAVAWWLYMLFVQLDRVEGGGAFEVSRYLEGDLWRIASGDVTATKEELVSLAVGVLAERCAAGPPEAALVREYLALDVREADGPSALCCVELFEDLHRTLVLLWMIDCRSIHRHWRAIRALVPARAAQRPATSAR